jgi:hypothetical protein
MAVNRDPVGSPVDYPAPEDTSWASTNARAAEEALQAIREALHSISSGSLKSTNKWSGHRCAAPSRYLNNGEYKWEEFEAMVKDDQGITKRLAMAKASLKAWRELERNCGALSLAAQDYLARHFPNVQTSRVTFREDHVMVVVGSVKPSHAERQLSEWPRHLFACDPWANITCPVSEYPQRYREKMRKWQSDGKRLLSDKRSGKWESPLDWLKTPDRMDAFEINQLCTSGQFLRRWVKVKYADD